MAGATLVGLAMFATLFLGADPGRVPHARRRARRRRERPAPAGARAPGLARARCWSARFAAAAAVSGAYVVAVALATMILTWAIGGWWPDRVVTPLLAPGARRGDHRRAVAGRLGRARLDGQRDRGVHALRRRADGRAARPDRRGAELGHAAGRRARRALGAAVRGALPGGPGAAHGRHRRLHAAGDRRSARSAARRPRARCCGCGRSRISGLVGAAALAVFKRRDL